MNFNVDRPCLKKCELNENNVCLGCFRTLNDMHLWYISSQDEKFKMLYLAELRQKEYKIKQKVK